MKVSRILSVITLVLIFAGCPGPAGNAPEDETPVSGSDADLSSLTVSAGVLNPPFSAETTVYSVDVPNAVEGITVTGSPADAAAAVSANSGAVRNLDEGPNIIVITVTAQDGTTTKDYSVTVTRSYDYISTVVGILKYVPAGAFQRDGTAANISRVSAFRMGIHEVTRAQFQDVMGTDPSSVAFSTGTDDPVQNFNSYHALAFCNKLSLVEGLTPVYAVSGITDWAALAYASIPTADNATWNAAAADWEAGGYRLPTEMEWMWAAMGAPADGQDDGVNTTGYLKAFAGSDGVTAIGDFAWYETNGEGKSHPVGTKSANELGLRDMSGNICERCWDRYGDYPGGTLTDYRGASSGAGRVQRGGNWWGSAIYCSISQRSIIGSFTPNHTSGFRVIRR